MTSAAEHPRQGGFREGERARDIQEYGAAMKGASRSFASRLSNAQTAPPHLTRPPTIRTRGGSKPATP